MTRGHYSHMDKYESGDKVKLYEVPKNTWIIFNGMRLLFEKVDGMYSICKTEDGQVLHVAAYAEVNLDE